MANAHPVPPTTHAGKSGTSRRSTAGPLQAGTADLELSGTADQRVRSRKFRNRRAILGFYPRDRSPICRDAFALLTELLREFGKHNAYSIGISFDGGFDWLFTTDNPGIVAFHDYPWLIHRLTYRRANHKTSDRTVPVLLGPLAVSASFPSWRAIRSHLSNTTARPRPCPALSAATNKWRTRHDHRNDPSRSHRGKHGPAVAQGLSRGRGVTTARRRRSRSSGGPAQPGLRR